MDRVTIWNNTVEMGVGCGGLYCNDMDSSANFTVSNSIIFGNSGSQAHLINHHDAVLLRMGYSDFEGGVEGVNGSQRIEWGEGNIDTDPQFVGDCRVTDNSPCIDSGDPDAPRDPDGTRSDMGAFYFHQRDIAIEEREILFPPTPWGELDILPITITNDGLTPLEITQISNCLCMSCVWTNKFPYEGAERLIIPPEESYQFQVYFRPDSAASMARTIFITSNDPDEPEITVEVTGQVMAVESDELDTYPSVYEVSAFPNPFNSSTRIRFAVGARPAVPLRLAIYDLSGRLVTDLTHSAFRTPHSAFGSVIWNACNQPAGVYFIRLESSNEVKTIKTLLMK